MDTKKIVKYYKNNTKNINTQNDRKNTRTLKYTEITDTKKKNIIIKINSYKTEIYPKKNELSF